MRHLKAETFNVATHPKKENATDKMDEILLLIFKRNRLP